MSRRLGQLMKFILVGVALAACGGSSGSSSLSGPVATELQTSINGWSFPNYPASEFPNTDFNEADLVSMFGSGNEICVGGVATPCKLTAEASAWARMVNQSRASGACEGLVAIASTRFNKKEQPSTVKIPAQDEALHAIMRAFATQFLPEVQDAITMWLNKSLDEKIAELTKSFTAGTLNYTLGLYTEGGGHALLPYAIEYPTPSTPKILLYDSNWPGKNRYIDVDLKAKTWRFSFAGEDPANDPNAWTGGPQDMDLTPLAAREGTCPFCGDGTKVEKTTMLIRSSNLDWSVETDGGVVSPTNPVGTDGTSVLPVKGFLKRDSYDYFVSVPTSSASKSATTIANKKAKKNKSKLKFSGTTSVYAIMPDGIAQFTTPGTSNNPVEIEGSSISTKDPGVDLTLASGNLVANASGAAISLSISEGTMEVAVTTASGQVVEQQVSEDKPTLQMKADSTGGGITVLAASSTGVVEKTEVSSTGVETKTVVKEVLNLSAVKAELPPELASKEIAALPSIATRNMANPNYKIDPVYTAPTTTVPKESSGGVSSKGVPQAPTVGRLILPSVEFGEAPFTAQAPTSNSKGEWKFSSSKSEIAQINATTGRITVTGAGTTTITATQAAVKDYESISVTADLIVVRATPVLGAFTTANRAVGEEAFVLASPTSTSSAAFKFESSDESVAKFSKVNGKLQLVGAGKTTITASQPANDDYLAASKNFVLTVRKGTPVLTATADVSSTFGEIGPAISKPTSDSRGAITFTSSNPAVATINATTGQTSIVNAGTSTVTITQAATEDYVSTSQTITFTVKPALPALGALSVGSKTFGDAGFSIAKPTSPSSGSFTFTSSNSRVIKISEAGVATIEGAGTATITASQAAAGNYAANSVTAEITVAKGAPELSNISLTGLVFGAADVTMQPRSTSAGAFSFFSNNARVLTVNETSGRVSVVGAGTATVTVRQASTTNYESASSSVTVQVGLATPAFERLDPISKDFGDSSFIFNWGTSPSDGAITYSSNNSNVATINATTGRVTIVGTGVATLTMSQGIGTNHTAASIVAVLTVGRGTPIYGDFIITNKTYGAAPFLLTRPTTTSSGAFTFTTRLNDTSVATVNSSTGLITIVAPGSVEIIAAQAQTDTHSASSISTTFVVSAATPTFGSFVAPSKTFGDAAFTMSAPSSPSSGAFTFSSSNTNVATITSTGTVAIIGAGSTTITASQAAASPYTARAATSTFTVAKATPSLSSLGGESAGLTGTRYVDYYADNPNWFATATLQGQTVTSTRIQGFTSSSDYYSWQWLGTFRSSTAGTYNFCTASDDASHLWIGTTATSGFTTANAVVNNGGLHPVVTRCGNVTLAASSSYPIRIQFGEWGGGDSMSVYFTPPGGSATYDGTGYFYSGSGLTKTVGDQPFTPTIPTSVSTGAITYSSSNPAIATIDPTSGLITVISGGTTTITAEQAATSNYNSSSVSTTLTVLRNTIIGAMSALVKNYNDSAFTLTAPTSNSDAAITYTSSDTSVATVDATTGYVTIFAGGTTTITASQLATSTYAAATTSTTLTVLMNPMLGAMSPITKTYGEAPFTLTAPTTNSDAAITYTSSDTSVATVDATTGYVTIAGVGSTTIIASQAATASYTSASTSTTLTVITGATPQTSTFTTYGPNDYYFSLVAGTTFTVRTYAWEYQIDSQIWLYNDQNSAVAVNDDYYGLDSYISYVVQSTGTYRLRTSVCCWSPDAWYRTSYRVETNLSNVLIVTTDEQGGSAIDNVSTAIGGTISSSPGAPTRSGYTFNGWFTAPSGGSALSFPYTHNQTANFTLYAQWTDAAPTCANGGACVVGDIGPGGGRIFLLPTSTGNTTNKYFEAAPSDLTSAMAWCNDTSTSVTGAHGYALGTGEANTTSIDAACTSGAAQGAADYTNNGISDWYLPSLDELTAMLNARATIGGFANASYWSSSEENGEYAKRLGFPDGGMSGHVKYQWFQVRPIRSFEIRSSCLDIKNATGTNTNGMYTIALNVNGTIVNTQVYCLMDSAMSGGGWTLTMKAPSYSTSFGFYADYWTTANTLNEGNTSDVTSDATDAKFNTFNYLSGTEMLAIFPDAGINGGSVTGQTYGWTWLQTIPGGPKTPLQIFSGPIEQFVGDADNFSGFDTRIFSRQSDIRFYGFNWYDNHQSRWGFGWNENGGGLWPYGVRGSDDVSGGIGLGYGSYSAGDLSFGYSTSDGLNRPMSFETYVR